MSIAGSPILSKIEQYTIFLKIYFMITMLPSDMDLGSIVIISPIEAILTGVGPRFLMNWAVRNLQGLLVGTIGVPTKFIRAAVVKFGDVGFDIQQGCAIQHVDILNFKQWAAALDQLND